MKASDNPNEPSFRLNYATLFLGLVILIPFLYLTLSHLENPKPVTAEPVSTNNTPVAKDTAAIKSQVEQAEKAAAESPSFQTYLNLGMIYYNAEKFPESIKAWEKALEYDPQSYLVYNNIAAAYGSMRKWDEEIAACEKALALNPSFELAKRNLAWAKSMKLKK